MTEVVFVVSSLSATFFMPRNCGIINVYEALGRVDSVVAAIRMLNIEGCKAPLEEGPQGRVYPENKEKRNAGSRFLGTGQQSLLHAIQRRPSDRGDRHPEPRPT